MLRIRHQVAVKQGLQAPNGGSTNEKGQAESTIKKGPHFLRP
jgi:hypothetical protein